MDVKQAVSLATGYFRELFPQNASGLELEEVEYVSSDGSWLITLGYDKPEIPIYRALGKPVDRDYKVVHVASDGTPTSIKMRRAS